MNFSNYFDEVDEMIMEGMLHTVHERLETQFETLFKLDEFPGLTVDFSFNPLVMNQSLAWAGTQLRVDENNRVKSIIIDEIVLKIVPMYTLLKEVGFENMLNQTQFDVVFMEFSEMLMLYQLIKAHDLKYVYDRFIGEDAIKPQSEIVKPMIKLENTLHYYRALQNFYDDKLPNNVIGRMFADMNFDIIDFVATNKSMKDIYKDTKIIQSVWKIVSKVKEIYPDQANSVDITL
jgi:hypothetical protein